MMEDIDFEEFDEVFSRERYRRVAGELLRKMVREFSYEELIDPEKVEGPETEDGWSVYRFSLGDAVYRFRGRERYWDSVMVEPGSVEVDRDGGFRDAYDPFEMVSDLETAVEMSGLTAGHLAEEYLHTVLADLHIDASPSREVLDMGYGEIECEMRGHPWITFNKGRIGWSYDDFLKYAPERRNPVRLDWCAVSRENAEFASLDVTHDELMESELGGQFGEFREEISSRGLDPDRYYLLPVHDYQWSNAVVPLYLEQIANREVVPLGTGDDRYLPMQSVRTFVNIDDTAKCNVKVPMMIKNTLVWRGLPGERTLTAPVMTEYVKNIRDNDPFLTEDCGLVLPGEIAGLNCSQQAFDRLESPPYQFLETLGCIWRESLTEIVDKDEKPITLSALLHVDDGEPLVSELIERSGLSVQEWLHELFDATLPPLLHYLYRYGTVFSPHGQNAILVLEDCTPSRLAVKDFVDDVNVSEHPIKELENLPEDLRSVLRTEPPEGLCWFIVHGLFVGVLRYLSDVLTRHHCYPEKKFWRQVYETVLRYQERFPELEDRFDLFDLFQPCFTKLCLNRNRITDYGYGSRDGRPHATEYGTVANPLHRFDG
ncbi:MAG: IucA/IucC family siderophore biosynthesis protein [Halobacteria archaeon]